MCLYINRGHRCDFVQIATSTLNCLLWSLMRLKPKEVNFQVHFVSKKIGEDCHFLAGHGNADSSPYTKTLRMRSSSSLSISTRESFSAASLSTPSILSSSTTVKFTSTKWRNAIPIFCIRWSSSSIFCTNRPLAQFNFDISRPITGMAVMTFCSCAIHSASHAPCK